MTTSSKQKRLHAVETTLTPKEWAIKLADEIRKHPSAADFCSAIAEGTDRDCPVFKPYLALGDQAKERHSGSKPEDIRARAELNRAFRMEYHALKRLIFDVNRAVKDEIEVAGLKASLKLAKLETIVLEDAFGRTARITAELVEGFKAANAGQEANRQSVLKELAAYRNVGLLEMWSDSIPYPGDNRIRFQSAIEDRSLEVTGLAVEVFTHRAAVQVVQEKHFDGHAILALDVEAGLAETIKVLEDEIAVFNEYLNTRSGLLNVGGEIKERNEEGLDSAALGDRRGNRLIETDAIRAEAAKREAGYIAAAWIKNAKEMATADILEESNQHESYIWDRFRERAGVEP